MMQIAPMKHPRAGLDAVTLNGHIYVVGGEGPNRVPRNDGESYDPGAMMWSDLSENLASGRSACTVEAMGTACTVRGAVMARPSSKPCNATTTDKANGIR
jgi:hypothetical protein